MHDIQTPDVPSCVQNRLFSQRDDAFRAFHLRLIPTVDPDKVIGVRTPAVRKLAKALPKPEAEAFLRCLPHRYYEENNLHAALLEPIRDYDRLIAELDRFLPYVDNWATCDMLSPVLFRSRPERLLHDIDRFLASQHAFTVRFGLEMLMKHYLGAAFTPAILERAAAVRDVPYYVHMMVAWFFATALAAQYAPTLPVLEQRRLSPETHNKAIQKATESRRLTAEQKAYLRTLRIRDNIQDG